MKTEKIYYKNQFQTSCEAVLIERKIGRASGRERG